MTCHCAGKLHFIRKEQSGDHQTCGGYNSCLCDMVSTSNVIGKGLEESDLQNWKSKSCLFVYLTAKVNREKKSFIASKGLKHKAEKLNQEFSGKCVLTSSPNEWTDTEVTIKWLDKVLRTFTFGRNLSVYSCHIEDSLSDSIKQKNIDEVLVPDGYTYCIQALKACWNRLFKPALYSTL